MSNRIETLLNNAKQQNPLLTESDLSAIISNKNLLVKKQSFFTLKNILIMSVVCTVIAGLWLGFISTPTQNLVEPLQVSKPAINDSLAKQPTMPETTIKKEPLQASSPAKNILLARTPTTAKISPLQASSPAINKKQEAVLFEPFNSTPIFSETNTEDNRTYFDENGYLILTNEELAKLGIITDGIVLKYENVTDTFFTFKENGKTTTQHTSFKLKVEKHGSRSSSLGIIKDTLILKKSLPFWATGLSIINFPTSLNTTNKKDSSHQLIEFLNGNSYEKDFLKEMEWMLVPIVVYLKSVPHKYSSDLKLIFWFKTEPKFYNALTNEIAKAVKNKYGTSTENDFKKLINKYRSFARKTFQKGFDSLNVARLQKNYVQLNDKQLNKLGITKSEKKIKIVSFKNFEGRTKILRVKMVGYNNYYNTNLNKWNLIKKKDSPYNIVATTDYNMYFINYLRLYPDSITETLKRNIESEYFRKNIDSLIPIEIDSNHIIWFESSEKLKNILSGEEQNESRKIDLTKVKLLEFNEKELLNLGIKLEKNGILIPMISFVELDDKGYLSFLYKKNVKEGDVVWDTSNINNKIDVYKKYPIPILTTDPNGLKWYSYTSESSTDGITFENYEQRIRDKLKILIPITINHLDVSLIAWYEPDSLFLSTLPNTQATEIKNDLEAISTNQPTLSCKYFEACQNISGEINSYLAYPNPAEQTLNIEIDLAEERNLEFIITDITGKIIKTLNQNLNQAKGIQTYTYQIGELTEGMYLLIITTNKGEKVSTRIVKK